MFYNSLKLKLKATVNTYLHKLNCCSKCTCYNSSNFAGNLDNTFCPVQPLHQANIASDCLSEHEKIIAASLAGICRFKSFVLWFYCSSIKIMIHNVTIRKLHSPRIIRWDTQIVYTSFGFLKKRNLIWILSLKVSKSSHFQVKATRIFDLPLYILYSFDKVLLVLVES